MRLFGDEIVASRVASRFVEARTAGLLRLAIEDLFPKRIALVSSFGAESAVLLHMVATIDPSTPVLFVDTGRHFRQTHAYRRQLCDQLGLSNCIVVRPGSEILRKRDPDRQLFDRDPDICCQIRKVDPLDAALEAFDAWISGRKAFQGPNRSELPLFEVDGEKTKINPLVAWSASDLQRYIGAVGLPPHPLLAHGFASIGCRPCTSVVHAGENVRAGRWLGMGKSECGIHGLPRI